MTTRTGATLLLFIVTGMNSFVLADPPGPAGPGGDPTNAPAAPVGAPLDNGTWILLGLAVFFGLFLKSARRAGTLLQTGE